MVYSMLTDRNIVSQILLVYSSKWSQEVSHLRPQPFYSVGVNLSDTIPIIIACPFSLPVIYCRVLPPDPVVASPLICVTSRPRPRILMHLLLQILRISSHHNSQPALAASPPYGADYGRSVVVIVAVPVMLVCPSSWRVVWMRMPVAFFPPHFETFHQSQSQSPSTPHHSASYSRYFEAISATCERSHATGPTRRQELANCHLCICRAEATRPCEQRDWCRKRSCRCKGCRKHYNLSCNGNQLARAWSDERAGPDLRKRRNEGSVIR